MDAAWLLSVLSCVALAGVGTLLLTLRGLVAGERILAILLLARAAAIGVQAYATEAGAVAPWRAVPFLDLAILACAAVLLVRYPDVRRPWAARAGTAAVVLLTAAAAFLLALDPALFWDLGALEAGANPHLEAPVGPLYLLEGLILVAYAASSLLLHRRADRATGDAARRARTVALGFGVTASYNTVALALTLDVFARRHDAMVEAGILACLAVSALLLVFAALRALRGPEALHGPRARVLWLVLPPLTALPPLAMRESPAPFADSVLLLGSLWRFALPVAVLHTLLDRPTSAYHDSMRQVARIGLPVATAVVGAMLLMGLVAWLADPRWPWLLTAAVLAFAAALPLAWRRRRELARLLLPEPTTA